MNGERILIIGAYGQLGKALHERYPDAIAVDRDSFDMTDQAMLDAYDWSKVDVILNAAAYTNVDGAETDEGRVAAWNINGQAVANLARKAIEHDLTLVHISSDYVFDGTKSPHFENELMSPLGVYGQSKAAGDITLSVVPKHYLLRTSWVIGEGKNFVRTMVELAAKNISPTVVADQIGRPTFTATLVDAIVHLVNNKADYGTYNVSNDGEAASWADITRAIFKELGRDDLTVTDTTTKEYFASKSGIAPRPLQSTLSLGRIKATGLVLRDWRDDLASYIKQQS
jgi:dTDP-4-dehydrorhamnose 3,5-epimerase